ncbi:MAG: indolepyruvate ferredoxin oxidoreductase subunit alpha [Clostridiales bacterium]|nr:indolepyruvate ferredoxin oxidoreductase subunit alpha [Clostridiales bacterium]
MKKLMLGNEAAARGLYEAGCTFVSSYPGTPSTEITEFAAKYDEIYAEWAPNEKVAMESAFGACLTGQRTFCGMKHVGLNVAADPLFTISYTGVNGGMIIGVADDPGMHSSQNEQDSRHYARASKIPMVEPSDSREAIEYVKLAYEISEKYDTPVLLKMCTRVSHSQSVVEPSDRVEIEPKPYKKDGDKYIMMPRQAKLRHPLVEQRTLDLMKLSETSPLNRIEEGKEKATAIITDSTSYQYVKEILGDRFDILKLGLIWPVSDKLLKDFTEGREKVVIVEELDGFIEGMVKALGIECVGKEFFSPIDELSQNKVREGLSKALNEPELAPEILQKERDYDIPARPPVMCAGCPHRGLFYVLSKLKLNVIGDIGCYTLGAIEPLNAIDTTICMGASVSGIHGFNKAASFTEDKKEAKTVAVIGDSTFMHSGITGLVNIAYNDSNSTVIILDNSITGMTGHQQNPTTGMNLKGDPALAVDLEALCHAVGIASVRVVDPYDLKETERVIKEELAKPCSSVVISRRPCALLKYVKHKPAIVPDKDKCTKCRMCMKIGCPAIMVTDKGVEIDHTLCVGCGVCTELCHFGALGEKEASK